MLDPRVWWRWQRQWRREHLQPDRPAVLQNVQEGDAFGPRYAFMVVMSCGIATLGLLQNSAAVIIGAMLISPLMGPIIGLGMSLATFDFANLRASLKTLAVGVVLALLISALLVALSPLQEPTAEILARTEPTLFDLLVAVFSGLAGAYATITRKGETIVGVAIATALMPPLAVVGFGLATGNGHIAGGAFFLFMTNLLAIALSVTIMARWYGFGGADSPKQTAWQAVLIVGTFVLLSVPLGLALRDIAARGLAERTIRAELDQAAREGGGRIASLRVDRDERTLVVDAIMMTPTRRTKLDERLERTLEQRLGQPVVIELREVLTANDAQLAREQASIAELRESISRLQGAAERDRQARDAQDAQKAALRTYALEWFGPVEVLDGGRRVRWHLDARAGFDLEHARALEVHLGSAKDAPVAEVVPSLQSLPSVRFGKGSSTLSDADAAPLELARWAVQRWRAGSVRVTAGGRDAREAQARADAVAAWLGDKGIATEVVLVKGNGHPADQVDLALTALAPAAR